MIQYSEFEKLFNEVINFGYKTRISGEDGLKTWISIKEKYGSYEIINSNGLVQLRREFIELMKIVNYQVGENDKDHEDVTININGYECKNKNIPHHFLVQHFRIPVMGNYKLPVIKIFQIAYNIGQLRAVFEKENVYDEKIIEFYNKNGFDKFSTFLLSTKLNSL